MPFGEDSDKWLAIFASVVVICVTATNITKIVVG